ncbi:MAG: hypothetical protein ACLFVD_03885 [Dehalococcoidia bacterium]
MAYCRYCGRKVDEEAAFCHWCGESTAVEDARWQEVQVQEAVDQAEHRANIYTIITIVLVTLGLAGGGALCISSDPIGLFGIVLVCLGVAFMTAATRHGRKASNLRRQLGR